MTAVARYLADLAEGRIERANHRERLQAAMLIYDRMEGKPVAKSITLHANALPSGFDVMSPDERDRLLDIDETLMLGDGGDDDLA